MPSPNLFAPNITTEILRCDYAAYAGDAAGDILYGVVIILYFECVAAILKLPPKLQGGRKWGLLAYTTFLFVLGTIYTYCNLRVRQLSYIDNSKFPGEPPSLPPGPVGYTFFSQLKPTSILSNASFTAANWMADGLLMYRAYITYNKQPLVLVFHGLGYLASISMGIMVLYQTSRPDSSLFSGTTVSPWLPYFTISVVLNVLLTVTIAWRLFLHEPNLREALGYTSGINSIYMSVVTIFVESCAIYAAVSICFSVPYAMSHHASAIFLSMLSQIQIIAPLLIIHRVATQRALTASRMTTISMARSRSASGTNTHNYLLKRFAGTNHIGGVNITTTIESVRDPGGQNATKDSPGV